MLVIPIAGDRISIDGWAEEQVVTSYSFLKKGGALYVKNPLDPKIPFVGLSQVLAINKVVVTQNSTGVFVSKGLIKRLINLPQIGDTITVIVARDSQGIETKQDYKVDELHLTNKATGPLMIKCGKSSFHLGEVVDIKRNLGSDRFSERTFRSLYLDYMPIGS